MYQDFILTCDTDSKVHMKKAIMQWKLEKQL